MMNRAEAARARTMKSVALRDAVISGKSHQVAACLLHNGMDPEGAGLRGGSPLRHAAEAGNSAIVDLLIAAGANVNRGSGRLQSTALHAACEYHRVEVVDQLLAAGADPKKSNGDMQTPLHSACYGGSARVVATLLGMGAVLVNRNDFGGTPLSLAATHGHFGVVKLLLVAGADPDAPGTNGDTPLHIASAQGHFKIVVELLLAGAYPSPRQEQTDETPLFIAARAGLADIVRLLLHADANPALKTNGWTPLDIATHKVHVSVMREFLRHPGVQMESHMTYNALRLAAAGGSHESVAVLLHAGVSPRFGEPVWVSRQDSFGEEHAHTSPLSVTTPIEEARRYGHDDVVYQLKRALVDNRVEAVPASRAAAHGTVVPFAKYETERASTPPRGSRYDEHTASSGTGGLAFSLLKGGERCDNAVSDVARKKRDPERKVRFDVPETPTVEIVEAFQWTSITLAEDVYTEENGVVDAVLPSSGYGMLEEDGSEEEWTPAVAEVYTEDNEVADTTVLPSSGYGMLEEDGSEEEWTPTVAEEVCTEDNDILEATALPSSSFEMLEEDESEEEWAPTVAGEVYTEDNEVLDTTVLPSSSFEMREGDGTEEGRGSLLHKEGGLHNIKKAQTLEDNIIQWCKRVRSMNETNGRLLLPLLLDDGAPENGGRSTTSQLGQDGMIVATVSDNDNGGRNSPTADACRAHEENYNLLIPTEVRQLKTEPASTSTVMGPKGGWSDSNIYQAPINVRATPRPGLKGSWMRYFLCMPSARAGVERWEEDPTMGRSATPPCASATAGAPMPQTSSW